MTKKQIVVLNYGTGNIGSLVNMFRHIGAPVAIADRTQDITSASAIVLPGVGHFGIAAERLARSGLKHALTDSALEGIPLLGVCVGMQLLFESSEEGDAEGLGLMKGRVVHFDRNRFPDRLPLPNVGWRHVEPASAAGSRLLVSMAKRPRFYFVHSYHAETANNEDKILESEYGYKFTCGVSKSNITGFQFHPEKSHVFGMTLLQNWIKALDE